MSMAEGPGTRVRDLGESRRLPGPRPSATRPDATATVVRLGLKRRFLADLYHSLLHMRWRWIVPLIALVYVVVNSLFAIAYMACGDGIENARPGQFADAFFFSVQTLATIGYGKMVPRSPIANLLVAFEALIGMVGTAMATGLMFAKFSRPTARVIFSNVAVVTTRDGVPSLMFRMANERGNQIVEATLHVVFARTERTLEGESVRRFYDLELSRSSTALFTLTWTAIHPIVETSPLFGRDVEQLRAARASIIVSLMGYDETFSQTVHARHSYEVDDIRWDVNFEDILLELPDGRRAIDYSKFHDVKPRSR
jgi:inward rectifier potassium channel